MYRSRWRYCTNVSAYITGCVCIIIIYMSCFVFYASCLICTRSICAFLPVICIITTPCSICVCMYRSRWCNCTNISAYITSCVCIIVIYMSCFVFYTSCLICTSSICAFMPVICIIIAPCSICMCMYWCITLTSCFNRCIFVGCYDSYIKRIFIWKYSHNRSWCHNPFIKVFDFFRIECYFFISLEFSRIRAAIDASVYDC